MARCGLLDVPGNEPGHPAAWRALRLDLKPQLRGTAGAGRAHASRQPANGGRGCNRWALRRYPRLEAGLMEAFRTVRGSVLPLNRADVDTDQIIPAKYLKRIERTGF